MSTISNKRSKHITDQTELNRDVLQLIFDKLSFLDLFRCKQVCSSWNSSLNSIKIPPCLILPKPKSDDYNNDDNDDDDDDDNHHHRFFSLSYKKGTEHFYKFDSETIDQDQTLFLGSSNGWLVILNKPEKASFILNPFSREKLHIPSSQTLPPTYPNRQYSLLNHNTFVSKAVVVSSEKKKKRNDNTWAVVSSEKKRNDNNWVVVLTEKKKQRNDNNWVVVSSEEKKKRNDNTWAVVSSEKKKKKSRNDNTWVVVLHGYISPKLAYCKTGENSWNILQDSENPNLFFSDILTHKGRLYALTNTNTVQVWDFQSSQPTKAMAFTPNSQPNLNLNSERFPEGSYFCQRYLVESMEEFFLVTRVVRNFVNYSNGELILIEEGELGPLVCPYKTMAFCVHKMEMGEWVKVDCLKGRAVFVGGSESMCCSSEIFKDYEGNSIYFVDDNWDEMDVDYLYGGHDNGVYSLESKEVKVGGWFEGFGDKNNPPPLWLIPRLG